MGHTPHTITLHTQVQEAAIIMPSDAWLNIMV